MKQPQSRFEKLFEGLRVLMIYQPAAQMDTQGKYFCVGDAEDSHITAGARDYLAGLGFVVKNGKFCFKLDDQG